MDTGKIEHKENINKSSRVTDALKVATAAGIIAGGAAVAQNSTEVVAGENSWGARIEQSQQIDPTPTPEQVTEVTPTPTPTPFPTPTIGEQIVTPSPNSPPVDVIFNTPNVSESPAQLPKTGGAAAEDHRNGVKNKLMLALGAALSGIGIGTANKASRQRSSQK